MTKSNNPSALLDKFSTRSSLYEKLSHEFRERLDRAIVRRTPASYTALFKRFRLADHGVSFSAFYFYARRLRRLVDGLRLASLVGSTSPGQAAEWMNRAIAQHSIEAMMHEQLTPVGILRLTEAMQMSTRIALAVEKEASKARNADPPGADKAATVR